MQHLVMPLNIQEPHFKRAILQSPAYPWLWDRDDDLHHIFSMFTRNASEKAGCDSADLVCIRAADVDILREVNHNLYQVLACRGIIPVGPAVDGNVVSDLAPNALNKLAGKQHATARAAVC